VDERPIEPIRELKLLAIPRFLPILPLLTTGARGNFKEGGPG